MFVRALVLVALLAFPAGAQAATLGEVAPLELRGWSHCFTSTGAPGAPGAPGELAVGVPGGMWFVQATRSGLQLGETVKVGEHFDCQVTALRPGGAGVIVGTRFGTQLVAVVRDPGGTWSAPITLADDESERDGAWFPVQVDAAVSDRGDVIVAWKENDYGSFDSLDRITAENVPGRFLVARRAPGGAFAAAEQVGPTSPQAGTVHAGIAAAGEAFTAFTTVKGKPPYRVPVDVAIAPPGDAFGPPVHVADSRWLTPPILDVAPDGRALVVAAGQTAVQVAERAPGGGFAAPVPAGSAAEGLVGLSASLGADGAAAAAWYEARTGRTHVVTRAAGGALSTQVNLEGGSPLDDGDPFYSSETYFSTMLGSFIGSLTFDDRPQPLELTPDARAAFALLGEDRAGLATLALSGGPPMVAAIDPDALGSDALPIVLADGTTALVWTDSMGYSESENGRYRLRMAAEGLVTPADPPAPRVTFGAPRDRTLDEGEALRIPVTCSAACVVRAFIDSRPFPVSGTLRLKRAGRGELQIEEAGFAAPARRGPVRIQVSTAAPGALYPERRTVTVRIARSATVAIPLVHGLRARRDGKRVVVTFRADHADSDLGFFVSGDATRSWRGEPLVTRSVPVREGQREFRVVLPARPGLKWVAVRFVVDVGPESTSKARVR